VATASYRLLPEVLFPAPVVDGHADELKRKCPMNVFDVADIEDLLPSTPAAAALRAGLDSKDLASVKAKGARRVATAARPRNCTMCRECTRGDTRVPAVLSASAAADPSSSVPWSDLVKLRRVRDHFVFSVETTGAYSPSQVVREALAVLKEKALTLKRLFKGEQGGADDGAEQEGEEESSEEDAE
jgi:DNA-directed RNA polymerase I and III subunit RPAC1